MKKLKIRNKKFANNQKKSIKFRIKSGIKREREKAHNNDKNCSKIRKRKILISVIFFGCELYLKK